MNAKSLLIACLLLGSYPTLVCAESSYQRDLKQLTEQRDKALAAAAQPINRSYQASLQQLLTRATQAKDAEAVAAITEAIKAIEAPSAATAALSSDTAKYVGAWSESLTGGKFLVSRILNTDGSALEGSASGSSWKIVGNKLSILKVNGEIDTFDLPMHGGKLNGTGPDGAHLTLTKMK